MVNKPDMTAIAPVIEKILICSLVVIFPPRRREGLRSIGGSW